MIVEESFLASKSLTPHPQDKILRRKLTKKPMVQHCVERSNKCREILHYLTIDGRHSVMSNLEMIYQDATTENVLTYAENLEDLVSNIMYPIYSKRFSDRMKLVKPDHDAFKITTFKECKKYGQDCLVALKLLKSALKTFYRTYHVLNQEFDGTMSSSRYNWEKYYGTLVANTNFQFDDSYEEMWNLMKTSNFDPLFADSQLDVSSTRLQKDLVKLLESMMASNNISLPDFLGLTGYNDVFTIEHFNYQNNGGLEQNCSALKEPVRATCQHFGILKKLHPLLSLDPLYLEKTPCNLGVYLEKWVEYLDNMKQFSNDGSTDSAEGKTFKVVTVCIRCYELPHVIKT